MVIKTVCHRVKSRLIYSAMCGLFSFSAFALEPGWIGGVYLSEGVVAGQSEVTRSSRPTVLQQGGSKVSESLILDTVAANNGFYIGYRQANNNRLLVSYEALDLSLKESSFSDEASGFNLDGEFVYLNGTVHPFWSVGGGIYSLESNRRLAGFDIKRSSVTGVALQFGGGVKFEILDGSGEFDLSFRHQRIRWGTVDSTSTEEIDVLNKHLLLRAGLALMF